MKNNSHPYRIIAKRRKWMLPSIYVSLFALTVSLTAVAAVEKGLISHVLFNELSMSLLKAVAGFSVSTLFAIGLILGIEAKVFVGGITEHGPIEPTYFSKNPIQFYLCIVLVALISLGFFAVGVH